MVVQARMIHTLFLKAVRRHVADAISARAYHSPSRYAAEILETYPACPLERHAIEQEAEDVAAACGVSLPPNEDRLQ